MSKPVRSKAQSPCEPGWFKKAREQFALAVRGEIEFADGHPHGKRIRDLIRKVRGTAAKGK